MPTEQDPLAEEYFAHCTELLFVADREGALLRLSEPLARMLGPEVGAGASLAELVHPDDRLAFEAGWRRLGDGADAARLDLRLRAAGGGYGPWSLSARRAPASGRVHGHLREGARAELERRAEILRAMLDTVPVAVWAIDPEGTFFFQDGKGLGRAGVTPGQELGKDLFEVYAGQKFLEWVRDAMAGEATHALSDVNDIPWESWYVPIRDEGGRLTSLVGISLDISAAKAAEKELRAQLDLIERQRQAIRALSTPIIEVWDRVLTLPMVGLVDSGRAAEVMDAVLARVVETRARFTILDLTGVDAVDSGTAGHLIQMISAVRLLGAEGIITGIRPSVAQTIVQLGLDLEGTITLAKLRDGLLFCMKRMSRGA
jgi:rsbT co-antagonist protein RsbR